MAGVVFLAAAEISPEQLTELLANKQFRPAEVTLGKAVKIDVLSGGKKTGEITVPSGRVVQLQEVSGQSLRIRIGASETSVPQGDTDYVKRALTLKQEWDKKSLAEKRAKLIAESPAASAPGGAVPPSPAPEVFRPSDPVPAMNVPDKSEHEEPVAMDPQKKKLVRFLTSQPFKCVENGQMTAISTFRANGTYILNNGYEGKWKLDKNGELITYCDFGGKERINRYVYEEQYNKLAGKRDRKSEVQDNAMLYMAPEFVKK
jgi:hypothetical protein